MQEESTYLTVGGVPPGVAVVDCQLEGNGERDSADRDLGEGRDEQGVA